MNSGKNQILLPFNLICSTIIFYTAAKIYLLPHLPELGTQTLLVPILLFHSFRHLGLMFLAQGVVLPGMPPQFAKPAAYGDLITAFLAFASVLAITMNFKGAMALVWIFNLVGTADLILAIILATIYQSREYLGAAYWIPVLWVPALLVTHYIVFLKLINF